MLCLLQNTRSCMKRAGLPTPANHLIRSSADIPRAAEVVGFPAVIKPISGAASEGVVRVDSEEQLERCVSSCSYAPHRAWERHSVRQKPEWAQCLLPSVIHFQVNVMRCWIVKCYGVVQRHGLFHGIRNGAGVN